MTSMQWLDIYQILIALGDQIASRPAFVAMGAEPEWDWACRHPHSADRPPKRGQPSPWEVFVLGASAALIRRLFPLWLSRGDHLATTTARELAGLAARRDDLRRQYLIAGSIADYLARHPADWHWAKGLIEMLEPGASSTAKAITTKATGAPPPPNSTRPRLWRPDAPLR